MNRRQTEDVTIALRQEIITLLQEPMTVRELTNLIDATYHNINYHVDRMVELGCLAMSGRVKKSGATAFVYTSTVKQYVHPKLVRKPPTLVKKEIPVLGKIIRLTETTHWYSEKKKSGKVYIGSTLSDAYLSI